VCQISAFKIIKNDGNNVYTNFTSSDAEYTTLNLGRRTTNDIIVNSDITVKTLNTSVTIRAVLANLTYLDKSITISIGCYSNTVLDYKFIGTKSNERYVSRLNKDIWELVFQQATNDNGLEKTVTLKIDKMISWFTSTADCSENEVFLAKDKGCS